MMKHRAISFTAAIAACLMLPVTADAAKESYSKHYLNCTGPSGHHIVEVEKTCPLGGEKFKALEMGTYSTFGVYLDMRPVSYLPLPPPLPVCPGNGMVTMGEDYDKAALDKIAKALASDEYKKIYAEQHSTYYLLHEQMRIAGLELPEGAQPWQTLVSATWEADICGDTEKYRLYAKAAIAEMKAAQEKAKPDDALYWTTLILIPELHRRLGDFDAAQDALNASKGKKPANENAQKDHALVRELLQEAVTAKNSDPVEVRPKKESKGSE